MRSVHVVMIFAALAPHAALPARAAGEPRMAVLPLRAEGLPLNEAQRLNVLARQRAYSRGGYAVEKEDVTNEVVEAARGLGLDCAPDDTACIVRIGNLADVPFVLVGTAVGGVEGKVGLDLRIVDVASATEKRRVTALLPADIDAQMSAFNDVAGHLFSADALATLTVTSTPPGADIVVDGVVRGSTPLAAPIGGLIPGEHNVVVRKKSFLPRGQMLRLSAGESADLSISLEADPDALRSGPEDRDVTLPFITAAAGGVVAVAGVVTTVVGILPLLGYSRYEGDFLRAEEDRTAPTYPGAVAVARQGMQDEATNWSTWGVPSVATGGALVAVGAAALAAGLWWGFDAMARAEAAQAGLSGE